MDEHVRENFQLNKKLLDLKTENNEANCADDDKLVLIEKELNDVANLNPKVVDQMEAKLKEAHSTPFLNEFIIPNLEQD